MLYEVILTAECVVVIEAESAGEALSRACDETYIGDYEFSRGSAAKEIKSPVDQDAARRHANVVIDK